MTGLVWSELTRFTIRKNPDVDQENPGSCDGIIALHDTNEADVRLWFAIEPAFDAGEAHERDAAVDVELAHGIRLV
jgi:hypothetical protein